MSRLQVECPDELLSLPGQNRSTLEHLAQEAFLVRLYELGQISSGRAAHILLCSRREFLDVLERFGISLFDEEVNLEVETHRGR